MTAVAYNDWDADTAKLGRPVVSVFGGREMKRGHDASLTAADFDLGGEFTKDAPRGEKREKSLKKSLKGSFEEALLLETRSALRDFIAQGLGHGGQIPEELTGA